MQPQSIVLTDEGVAARVQSGDAESFGILMERYEDRLLRYARKFLAEKMDAEDCVQAAFIKAYENIRGYDHKRKFSSWMYRIAHNEFVDELRTRAREPVIRMEPDILFPHLMAPERSDQGAEQREMRELLDRHLNTLEPRYREPRVLHYFEDMSYRDIADILRIPVATVGVRLKRGRERMLSIIQNTHE